MAGPPRRRSMLRPSPVARAAPFHPWPSRSCPSVEGRDPIAPALRDDPHFSGWSAPALGCSLGRVPAARAVAAKAVARCRCRSVGAVIVERPRDRGIVDQSSRRWPRPTAPRRAATRLLDPPHLWAAALSIQQPAASNLIPRRPSSRSRSINLWTERTPDAASNRKQP